jgi:hypothetical protein
MLRWPQREDRRWAIQKTGSRQFKWPGHPLSAQCGCCTESASVEGSACRDRRHPAGAHAGAVGSSSRLRCGARPGVAPKNSLRSLRSLRSLWSNSVGESDHEARCARRPQACAPRRSRNRSRRVPPVAKATTVLFQRMPLLCLQRRAHLCARKADVEGR